jgi:hypothetical protein
MMEGLLDTEKLSDMAPAPLPPSLLAQAGVAPKAPELKCGSAQAVVADATRRLPETRASKTEVPTAAPPPSSETRALAYRHSYLSVTARSKRSHRTGMPRGPTSASPEKRPLGPAFGDSHGTQ